MKPTAERYQSRSVSNRFLCQTLNICRPVQLPFCESRRSGILHALDRLLSSAPFSCTSYSLGSLSTPPSPPGARICKRRCGCSTCWSSLMAYTYLFGPVPSRRLGMSLGVDLVPRKVCTLDCVYCEVGRTTTLTSDRKEYIPAAAIIEELGRFFATNTIGNRLYHHFRLRRTDAQQRHRRYCPLYQRQHRGYPSGGSYQRHPAV